MSEGKNFCHQCFFENYTNEIIRTKGNKYSNGSCWEDSLINITIDKHYDKNLEVFYFYYS